MLLYVYYKEIRRYANGLILRLRIAASSNVQNTLGHYFYTATIAYEFLSDDLSYVSTPCELQHPIFHGFACLPKNAVPVLVQRGGLSTHSRPLLPRRTVSRI